jgi:hypothetical protein
MADDIKIRVGVQSSVKADMDRLVADMNKGVASMPKATIGELLERGKVIDVARRKEKAIEENEAILDAVKQSAQGQAAEYKKVADKISEEFGIAGAKSGAAYKRSLSGSGIKSALTQIMRGDVSGAIESLSEGLNLGMKSIAAKAVVWGGGILTAFTAGWKAGKALDEMLGISSKIANIWAGPALKGVGDTVERLRAARKEAEAIKAAAEETANFEAKRAGIIAERKTIGGTAQDRLDLETQKMLDLQTSLYEEGLGIEEQRKRLLAYEEQINVVKSAGVAADKESADLAKNEADEKRKQAEEEIRWNKEISDADAAASEQAFKRDVDRAAQREQDEKGALQKQLDGIQKGDAARKQVDDARRDRLQEVMRANAWGPGAFDAAADSSAFAESKRADRKAQSDFDRDVRRAEQAQARMDKGVATPRDIALLGAMGANARAKAARDEMAQMDKQAKQAAIDTAKNTRDLNDKIDAINKGLGNIVKD